MVGRVIYHGGFRPIGSTFFVFNDYARPAVRLAAISGAGVLFVYTHDSVGVGEDGPTHEPVEHLMALRAMPNLHVVRPSDANETVDLVEQYLTTRELSAHGAQPPRAKTSRRSTLMKPRPVSKGARLGGYVVRENDNAVFSLVATGSKRCRMSTRVRAAGGEGHRHAGYSVAVLALL